MEDFTLLKNSLIYQMSLGSKELYHSNVWAWLIEQDTDFVKVFFDESILDEYDVLGVARECKHRDLIIWLQKKGYTKEKCYLVIENKIKSLPTKEQLIGYTEDIWNYKLLGAVFTGIINPFGQDVETSKNGVSAVWKFVDYTTISYEIENILSNSRAETIINNSSVILEYSNVVRAISHLLNKELNNSVGKLTYAHDSVINELRFDDLYIKLKGADFISYVRQKANLLPTVEGFYLMIEQTFNNGKATLDFRFSNRKSDNDKWFVIGIQIEGTQYRTLVEAEQAIAKFIEERLV